MFGGKKEEDVFNGLTISEMQAILQDAGYKAQIEEGKKSRLIRSAVSGLTYRIFFYGIDSGSDRARSIQFSCFVGLNGAVAPEKLLQILNRWNYENRFVKVYADKDNDLAMEMDLWVEDGVTQKTLVQNIELWGHGLGEVVNFVRGHL